MNEFERILKESTERVNALLDSYTRELETFALEQIALIQGNTARDVIRALNTFEEVHNENK